MSEATGNSTKTDVQESGARKLEVFADDAKEAAGKFFGRVREFGESVAGSTRDMMGSAKLSSEKTQTERELSEAFQKLGELAYRHGGLTGEMAKLSDHIHELYEQLQNIEIRRNAQGAK